MKPKLYLVNLKETRERQGLTQEALAQRVGAERSAVANWEAQRYGTNRATLQAVATVLHVSPAYLTGETDDPHPNEDLLPNRGEDSEPAEPSWVAALFKEMSDLRQELKLNRQATEDLLSRGRSRARPGRQATETATGAAGATAEPSKAQGTSAILEREGHERNRPKDDPKPPRAAGPGR